MVREPAIMPEEVSGIHQSDDILRLLATELSMLGMEELEFEFYRRLLEKRLLSYRLQGDVWREQEFQRPITYQKRYCRQLKAVRSENLCQVARTCESYCRCCHAVADDVRAWFSPAASGDRDQAG